MLSPKTKKRSMILRPHWIAITMLAIMLSGCRPCWAEPIPDWGKLSNAIYKAEGGSKTAHPYGILARYRHTTPRQACINTCRHKWQDWLKTGQKQGYLEYLASKYAPIGANNDPTGLNKNWLANVRYFYDKG